jgi:flagella basal body P-ring formation protein FlgA
MQVEEERMRVIKDGDIIEDDDLEQLMAEADRLDREMLLMMRQAIAAALVREAA